MEGKSTLVIGASENPSRYSNRAVRMLRKYNIDVVALAKRTGKITDVVIKTEFPKDDIHTVTLYIGPFRQTEYFDKIVALKPQRVIFNPGTENDEFASLLRENNIEVIEACTLMMLSIGDY
jgi:predicted CoA-binding protein